MIEVGVGIEYGDEVEFEADNTVRYAFEIPRGL